MSLKQVWQAVDLPFLGGEAAGASKIQGFLGQEYDFPPVPGTAVPGGPPPPTLPSTLEYQTNKNVAGGYAGLDLTGLLIRSLLPPGAFVLPEDYGAAGDGVTDDTAAIRLAVGAASLVGGQVFFSRKQYRIEEGAISLTNVTLRGCGVLDKGAPYSGSGSTILVTGTVNPAFIVNYGVTIQGLSFYYPDQTEAACTANAGVPIVYPALFQGFSCSRAAWRECMFVNAYTIFQLGGTGAGQACGGIWITDCAGYAVRSVLDIKSCSETIYMDRCHWSYGWYQDDDNTGPTYSLRNWTANNSNCILVDTASGIYTSIDALQISNTYFFGHAISIHVVSGQVYNLQVVGCGFESEAVVFQVDAAANAAYARFVGGFVSTANVASPTAASTAFLLRSTGVNNLLSITGMTIASLCGSAIDLANQTGTGESVLVVSGNTIHGWGLQLDPSNQASYAISVTSPNVAASVAGNVLNSAAPNASVGINLAGVADAMVSGNTIRGCFIPVGIGATAGMIGVSGNAISNTTGGKSIYVAPGATGSLTLGSNAVDKP